MVYLLRHTTPHVEKGICYGQSDLALDPDLMNEEIAAAVESVRLINVTKIYTSPLQRCRQLAEAVCEVKGLDAPIVDHRLMELNFGDWEMLTWEAIFAQPEGKLWFDNFIEQPTLNGECFMDVIERAKSFFEEHEAEEEILIVTHDGFIRATQMLRGELNKENAFQERYPYGVLKMIDKNE